MLYIHTGSDVSGNRMRNCLIAEFRCLKESHKIIIMMCTLPVFEIIYLIRRSVLQDNNSNIQLFDIISDFWGMAGLWSFLILLFMYIYYRHTSSDGWKEVVSGIYKGLLFDREEILMGIFLIYLAICSIVSVLSLICTMRYFGVNDKTADMALCRMVLIWQLLPGIFSLLMGMIAATLKKTEHQVVALIVIFYIFYGGFSRFLQMVSVSKTVFTIAKLFSIFPVGTDRNPDFYYPFQLEFIHIIKCGIWIFAAYILFLTIVKTTKKKYIISVVMFIVTVAAYLAPDSTPCYASLAPYGAWNEDYMFYIPHLRSTDYDGAAQFEEEADFMVYQYDMNIIIDRDMKVDADLFISETPDDEYRFTLYHGFDVIEVTDGEGERLQYVRDGDYISVIPLEGKKISKLSIRYRGGSSRFYATSCAVFLPAWFAYYPIPGYRKIMDTETHEYIKNEGYEADYHISITSPVMIKSQLQESDMVDATYNFIGHSAGPTLIGSLFIDEITVNPEIRVIFSRMEYSERDIIHKFEEMSPDQRNELMGKVVIAHPNIGMTGWGYKDNHHYIAYLLDVETCK